MVHIKVNKNIYFGIGFIVLFFVSCEKTRNIKHDTEVSSIDSVDSKIQILDSNTSEKKDSLCEWNSLRIADRIKKKISYLKFDHNYHKLSKEDCVNLKWMKEGYVDEFYEITVFTEAYQLKLNDKLYLILMGQAAGATGIGVDYKEYKCYEYGNNEPILSFSSLCGGPLSVFFNEKLDCVGYWKLSKDEITDNMKASKAILSIYSGNICLLEGEIDKNCNIQELAKTNSIN